ncbi:hypothetical protein WICPIJ_006845 [Wickerhamomyces pijperi]|uniref:Uncharacterized protein n=1 Tax=Wickerhamomyces pijperi TaxID=599730 RepID=A0A9P8Q318_WICPI|nr:hypothetical protein WICPIJ_006845 [Wickerhamomyces pijperi]
MLVKLVEGMAELLLPNDESEYAAGVFFNTILAALESEPPVVLFEDEESVSLGATTVAGSSLIVTLPISETKSTKLVLPLAFRLTFEEPASGFVVDEEPCCSCKSSADSDAEESK